MFMIQIVYYLFTIMLRCVALLGISETGNNHGICFIFIFYLLLINSGFNFVFLFW